MGFKLQDKIQQMRGIPGKYKRVLTAIANRARNDGTNFFESKETVGSKSGVVRTTAYRNIRGLKALGIMVEAQTHECGNDYCTKGSRHYYAPGNHWVQAYNIDLVALQNYDESQCKMLRDKKESRVAKSRTSGVAKSAPSGVAICNTNRGTPEPRSTGIDNPSALTGGLLAGQLVSSDDSLRSSSSLTEEALASLEQQPQNPDGSEPESEQPEENKLVTDTYWAIFNQNDIALMLGIPCLREEHDSALTRMATVLVQRNRSACWLKDMVHWMKEHKKFWAQRLHTGDRAVEQLAKHMESGSCCEQFDSYLVRKHGSDILKPSRYNSYLLPNYAMQQASEAAAIPIAKFEQEPDKGWGHAYHTPADIGRGVPSACQPGCGCAENGYPVSWNVSPATGGRGFDVEEAE